MTNGGHVEGIQQNLLLAIAQSILAISLGSAGYRIGHGDFLSDTKLLSMYLMKLFQSLLE